MKCIAPGVPDTYQGTEFWDLSLVDPDNRRPVDYAARAAMLAAMEAGQPGTAWQDGGVKLAWTATLLRLRRDCPALFHDGSWLPIACRGPLRDRVVCAARVGREQVLLLAGLLHPAGLLMPDSLAPRHDATLEAALQSLFRRC